MDKMKMTASLKLWQKHLKTKFGANPKFNKFFLKLQEEQARNVSKLRGLANRVAPRKMKSKDQDCQEEIQKVVKKKYKVAEIKNYLEDVATAVGHTILKTASQFMPSQIKFEIAFLR
ncbi:hypothetical protein DSO57_1026449 [Entomophthora muscae]|uniref:Uncharacterized protein n=1 Tax=Entomophthora muscae TaxID=34485 RepID=A0ACC2TPK2_9FUNG|nr:hypothetical protein DSO57_1026449 [Entomophthora muscae]